MSTPVKDPVKARSGRMGARARWGEPRVLRLDTLTPTQRRLVLALIDAGAAADAEPAPGEK